MKISQSKKTATKTTKTAPKTAKSAPTNNDSTFGYKAELDKVVKEIGTVESAGRAGNIVVRIVNYNNSGNKVMVARTGLNKATGEPWFSPKLGRLTGDELTGLLPLLAKAQKVI